MSECFRPRRVCALILAYVVALQALLMPLSAVAGASLGNSLCVAASADNSKGSESNDRGYACGAVCGVTCCAPILDGPPSVVIAVDLGSARPVAPVLAFTKPVQSGSKGPQIPRAPPLA
jgi:hypothetical protein